MVAIEGIIDFVKAPPIGALGPNLDTRGPYGEGDHRLTTWDGTHPVSSTYGLYYTATTVPPGWGKYIGYRDVYVVCDQYEKITLQVVVMHQLFGGAWVVDQITDTDLPSGYMRFTEAQPGAVGLHVAPGWAFDVYWLKLL